MKRLVYTSLASVLMLSVAEAAAPKKPDMKDFSIPASRSPFVIKTKTVAQPKKQNATLLLKGVAKFKDGWFVTLVDKKNLRENIYLKEGQPANKDGMRLVRVNQNTSDYLKTKVVVMAGGRAQTVEYNSTAIQKSYTAAKTTARKTNANRRTSSNRPPLPTTGNQNKTSNKSSGRRPRVRRTTPPPVPRTQ